MRVHLSENADGDIEAIGDYISRQNPGRAASFVQEIITACDGLGEWPHA
jgi:toxin ParE1/3/4